MVKQRNLFDPERIDILTDAKQKPFEESVTSISKLVIEAHNNGRNVLGVPRSKQKGFSDLPLFAPEQPKLF